MVLPEAMFHLPVKMSFRQNEKLAHRDCVEENHIRTKVNLFLV